MAGIDHLTAARTLRTELGQHWGRTGAFQWGKISAVHAGPPPTVDAYLDGASVVTTGLSYLSPYTPIVNDRVLVGRMQGPAQTARMVLGPLASAFPAGIMQKIGDIPPIVSAQASFVFSSIAQNYRELEIRLYGRTTTTSIHGEMLLRFNGDSGLNYGQQRFSGSGTTAGIFESGAATQVGIRDFYLPGASALTAVASGVLIRIPNYSQTNFKKWCKVEWGHFAGTAFPLAGQLYSGINTGFWNSTAAITSVTLLPATLNLDIGSYGELWGIP